MLTALFTAWKAFTEFLKLIPWQVWAVLGVVAAIWSYGEYKEHLGVKETTAKYEARDKARALEQERVDALANAKLAVEAYDIKRKIAYLESQLEEELKMSAALSKELKGRQHEFIPEDIPTCPRVPVGYVLWRDAVAAFANGGDSPASPGATDDALRQPSGLSLTEVGDLDRLQAEAFRSCRAWGTGWRDYAKILKQSCTSTIETLKGAP